MPKNSEIIFAEAKQDRSKKTLEDLLVAAHEIVDTGNPEFFTSRSLSKKTGYSLGTLNKRLTSIDKIFLWAIKKGRQRHLAEITKIIDEFNATLPIAILLGDLVDTVFSRIKKVNPKVICFYEDRIKKYGGASDHRLFLDVLVKPFTEAIKRDKTNTFRHMSEDELRLILRAIAIFTERPFVESAPFAGTKEHHRFALDNLIRLLGQ